MNGANNNRENVQYAFSLYSTDTEEQVASVHRGLDRCAALLSCLLSPEKNKTDPQREEAAVEKKRSANKKKGHRTSKPQLQELLPRAPVDEAEFPGAHKHRIRSSTPLAGHGRRRSKSEPRQAQAAGAKPTHAVAATGTTPSSSVPRLTALEGHESEKQVETLCPQQQRRKGDSKMAGGDVDRVVDCKAENGPASTTPPRGDAWREGVVSGPLKSKSTPNVHSTQTTAGLATENTADTANTLHMHVTESVSAPDVRVSATNKRSAVPAVTDPCASTHTGVRGGGGTCGIGTEGGGFGTGPGGVATGGGSASKGRTQESRCGTNASGACQYSTPFLQTYQNPHCYHHFLRQPLPHQLPMCFCHFSPTTLPLGHNSATVPPGPSTPPKQLGQQPFGGVHHHPYFHQCPSRLLGPYGQQCCNGKSSASGTHTCGGSTSRGFVQAKEGSIDLSSAVSRERDVTGMASLKDTLCQTCGVNTPYKGAGLLERGAPYQTSHSQPQTTNLELPRSFHLSATASPEVTAQSVQMLLKEMFLSFQHCLDEMRRTLTGNGNTSDSELHQWLSSLETFLHKHQTQLEVLLTSLKMASCASAGVNYAELSSLRLENTKLQERLLRSETEYSDCKNLLDQAQLQVEEQCQKLKLEYSLLQDELHVCKKDSEVLGAQKAALEKELEFSRLSTDAKISSLTERNTALEEQLSKTRKELIVSRDELLMTESAMEACRETLDMTRLSIKEKETELLQALDQLLGIRQYLAYFLSELSPVNIGAVLGPRRGSRKKRRSAEKCYVLTQRSMKQLRSLVDDGNSVHNILNMYMPSKTKTVSTPPTTSPSSLPSTPQPANYSRHNSCESLSSDGCNTLVPTDSSPPTHNETLTGRSKKSSKPCSSNTTACGMRNIGGVDTCDREEEALTVDRTRTEDCIDHKHLLSAEHSSDPSGSSTAGTCIATAPGQTSKSKKQHCPSDSTASCSCSPSASTATACNSLPCSTCSTWTNQTTSSEQEFQKDLATLDTEIARLQMQFRITMQQT